ncbi:(2Fe-2S)-binding protein [Deltaproteobacteria bacterium]|nr:(2Fe-2S)-binding protein [Deltaproteobacteria bacterium]
MKLRIFKVQASRGAPLAEIDAVAGEKLSHAVWLSGRIPPLPLCGGLGHCGRCRVRFVGAAPLPLPEEEVVFSREDLASGWRLACRRQVYEGNGRAPLDLELPRDVFVALHCPGPTSVKSVADAGSELVLAVDLGTTSVHWRALVATGRERGAIAAQGSFLNPQAGAGADVMSRLAVAVRPEGRKRLSDLVRERLRLVVASAPGPVVRMCLAANTAMTDIFLDRDVAGLCAAPYYTSHAGHELVRLSELPPVYIPPLPAPFVGGDVSAGLAALLHCKTPRPFVLADLGTNGELALVTGRGEVLLTSVPLGPALEGAGMECGRLAGPDAATRFSLTPSGLTAVTPGGTAQARGISATGYISLAAALYKLRLLDAFGRFADSVSLSGCALPIAHTVAAGFVQWSGQTRLNLPNGLWLSAADVEKLLKVKAAFELALSRLLDAAALSHKDVARICLAGALGEHVNPEDMAILGFVPACQASRIRAAGNVSLDGAALLALRPQKSLGLACLCGRARLLSLVEEADFQREYFCRMRFGD